MYRCIVIFRKQYIDTCKSCIVPSLVPAPHDAYSRLITCSYITTNTNSVHSNSHFIPATCLVVLACIINGFVANIYAVYNYTNYYTDADKWRLTYHSSCTCCYNSIHIYIIQK